MIPQLLAMVAVTFVVMTVMFLSRVHSVRTQAVKISYYRLLQGNAPDYVEKATRHFSNMFQMPVLFYTVTVLCIAVGLVTPALSLLAWLYVAARSVHAIIHLTYNNVRHRLVAFAVGNLCLLGLWIIVGANLI